MKSDGRTNVKGSGQALGIITLLSLLAGTMAAAQAAAPAPAAAPQSLAIDQTRYFPTPEIEREELKSRIAEASAWPPAAPDDPKALLAYLQRAESLLSRLQRHRAYLLLRASRDIDDRADADTGDQTDAAIAQLLATV
jgi:oligoendopeptidase F